MSGNKYGVLMYLFFTSVTKYNKNYFVLNPLTFTKDSFIIRKRNSSIEII